MNCERAQDCLLRLEPMMLPPETVRVHLAGCDDCRAWRQRIEKIDNGIQRLLVPAVRGKEDFIRSFLDHASQPTILPLVTTVDRAHRKQRGLRKLAGALAIASALLIFVLGWLLSEQFKGGPDNDRGEPNEIVRKEKTTPLQLRLKREPRWQRAKDAQERLAVLRDVGADVFKEAKTFAERKQQQQLLARAALYESLVRDGIVRQAKELSAIERNAVLQPLIQDLVRTESEARRRAMDAPELAMALGQIATSAEDGARQLRSLL